MSNNNAKVLGKFKVISHKTKKGVYLITSDYTGATEFELSHILNALTCTNAIEEFENEKKNTLYKFGSITKEVKIDGDEYKTTIKAENLDINDFEVIEIEFVKKGWNEYGTTTDELAKSMEENENGK